jgi:SAP domain
MSPPDSMDYRDLRVRELKIILRERSLPVSGKKAVLIDRLEVDDAAQIAILTIPPYFRKGIFPFFELPAEIRNSIYKFAQPKDVLDIISKEGLREAFAVLMICKQLYAEAIGIFYAGPDFRCYKTKLITKFLDTLGATTRSYITTLTFGIESSLYLEDEVPDMAFGLLQTLPTYLPSLKKLTLNISNLGYFSLDDEFGEEKPVEDDKMESYTRFFEAMGTMDFLDELRIGLHPKDYEMSSDLPSSPTYELDALGISYGNPGFGIMAKSKLAQWDRDR